MADKTPVRVVFNASNVATGMAEFQSGESVGTAFGGTGLTSVGSSLQILRVNAAGSGLEYTTLEDLGDIGSIGSTLTAPSNADFTILTAGTGNIILNDIGINDNTITTNRSNDDLKISASGTGTVQLENLKVGTSGATVTTILDEDAMGSDSATSLATQQSIKAYVDTHDANIASDTLTFTNKTFDVEATGNSISNIDVADLKSGVLDTNISSVSGSDDTLASAKAIKTYVDAQVTASDLDFSADDSTALSIDLDSEVLHFAGGYGISTSTSSNTITHAIDTGTTVDKTTAQTLTNKSIDFDNNTITNIEVDNLKSGVLDTDISSVAGTDTTLASAKAIKTYVDAQVTAQDLDLAGDSGTGAVDLDSQSLTIAGGTGLASVAGSQTVTLNIDSTVATLTGSQTLTNKVLTSPTINAFSGTGNGSITGTLSIVTTTTDDSFLITTTEASNNAAPVITLKRNSSSPADSDYLGRIKFKGENDADQEVQYGSISGKILDASDGTEDGAIELNVKKAGSNVIAARLNSDELKLLNGTTLDVDGAGTFAGSVTATSVTTNDIVSNGSNADITIDTAGTGNINLTAGADVIIPTNIGLQFTDANEKIESDGSKLTITSGGTAFALPTADGSAGQALVTDGAGTLSFDTVATTVSDDTLAIVRNNKNLTASARTIDSFNTTFNDSAWYMMVHNDLVNEVVSTQCFAVSTNGSAGVIGANRGIESGGGSNVPTLTADVSNTMVRLRAAGSSADCKTSFYKIPLSSANTADATRGNTITTSNTDVDSASESIDTFAHATFRGAKYFISIDNDSKTEVDTVEALVVHDGSAAYIASYGGSRTGSNALVSLSATISGDNVVVSAAGLETNLNLTVHKILIKDNMTAESNANQKAFAAVTVSSTATAVDTFDLDDANGAVYYIVSKNATEGSFAISEVFAAAAPGLAAVADGPQVSTKGTPLIEFTAGFDTATENSFELFASSTAGGSTTVTGYRISALAG